MANEAGKTVDNGNAGNDQISCDSGEISIDEKDAQNFYCHLIKRINCCRCANKKIEWECNKKYCSKECKDGNGKQCSCCNQFCDGNGNKIENYLNLVVPGWNRMSATRLYKHIQKMLENAEATRKFEIELLWKRLVYFMPVLILCFTAFGFVFFSYQNMDNGHANDFGFGNLSIEGAFLLLLLAFINLFFSRFVVRINLEGQEWQKNWEYHVDYLQAILGLNLMRTCLRKRIEKGNFSIGISNALISHFMHLVWALLTFLSFLSFLYSIKKLDAFDGQFSDIATVVAVVVGIVGFFIFSWEYRCFIMKSVKSRKEFAETEESYFRHLEGLQIKGLKEKIKELANL